MRLPVNIIVYVVFVLALYASQKWWKLLNMIGFSRGGELLFILALAYLLMLVFQVRREIRRGEANGQVVRRAFYFSLAVGCSWAFLQYVGSRDEAPPILFFYFVALFYGGCLGLLSMIITNAMFGYRNLK